MFKHMVYAHEHMVLDLRTKDKQDRFIDNTSQTIKELKELKQKGVDCIVDVTAKGMGRNPLKVQEISEKTGINILQSTGYYKEPYLPEEAYIFTKEQIADFIEKEITQGIDGTNIKARVIGEIGTDKRDFLSDIEIKLFKASSYVAKKLNIPIVTHTTLATLAKEQVELFKQEKVNLETVVISHMDLSKDANYVIDILKTGVNIAFDTIGKTKYNLDENRIELLKEVEKQGFANQITMSVDLTYNSHLKDKGGIGYNYLLDNFVKNALKHGVLEQTLHKALVTNPKRIFNL